MKKLLIFAWLAMSSFSAQAQSLEKMTWFNEPGSYTIQGKTLERMFRDTVITGGFHTTDLR